MTKGLKHQSSSTIVGHRPYAPSVVNAIARALTRLELTEDWAGADHDMPGTTQAEREASRRAARDLLDELKKDLKEHGSVSTGERRGGLVLTAGPFISIQDTVPAAEQEAMWGSGQPRIHMRTEKVVEERTHEVYHTRLYDPSSDVLTERALLEWLDGGDSQL